MIQTFGVKEEGEHYRVREGVYALIHDSDSVAIVGRVDSDLHELPGGGLENGESHVEGLTRELIEELGWAIEIGEYLGKGIQYTTLSPHGSHYRLEGHFYVARKVAEVAGKMEDDHLELWLPFTVAATRVKYEYQKWAIQTFESYLKKLR